MRQPAATPETLCRMEFWKKKDHIMQISVKARKRVAQRIREIFLKKEMEKKNLKV